MPKLVIMHAVEDVERWLKGKEERVAVLGAFGSNVTDFVAADGSPNVAVSAEVHDMDGLQAMMASPSDETMALMQKHGVVPPFTNYIEA